MSLLPFSEGDRIDPFASLQQRRPRLALAIAATTRRRDTRRRRAQVLLMLLQFKCPLGVTKRRAWYVPGAVARQGADGIESSWVAYWDENPPSMRTIRQHLRCLQDAGTLVAAPGDFLPILRHPEHPEHKPRYPDTFHILETDVEAKWWGEVGMIELANRPKVRHNPEKWAELFGNWRAKARRHSKNPGILYPENLAADALAGPLDENPAEVSQPLANLVDDAKVLEAAVRDKKAHPLELLAAVADIGARIRGGLGFRMTSNGPRLRGAVALLAVALRRGKTIHNRAGWLVNAWRTASADELREAIRSANAEGFALELVS